MRQFEETIYHTKEKFSPTVHDYCSINVSLFVCHILSYLISFESNTERNLYRLVDGTKRFGNSYAKELMIPGLSGVEFYRTGFKEGCGIF